MMQCSLVQNYPRKPRIEFRVSRRSKVKLSLILLGLLRGLQYDLHEEPIQDSKSDLIVIVFTTLVDCIKFWRLLQDKTDFYYKYTKYPAQKGTRLEWFLNGQHLDPYCLFGNPTVYDGMPLTWRCISIFGDYKFIFSPGLQKYHLFDSKTLQHIYSITPDAEETCKALGITIKT